MGEKWTFREMAGTCKPQRSHTFCGCRAHSRDPDVTFIGRRRALRSSVHRHAPRRREPVRVLAPKEESPILTKPLVAGLVTITVAGTLSLPLIFRDADPATPVNQFRPDMAFADGMAWHLRTAKTAFASISLDAAPAPAAFCILRGY